jgi:hypothetical protein
MQTMNHIFGGGAGLGALFLIGKLLFHKGAVTKVAKARRVRKSSLKKKVLEEARASLVGFIFIAGGSVLQMVDNWP